MAWQFLLSFVVILVLCVVMISVLEDALGKQVAQNTKQYKYIYNPIGAAAILGIFVSTLFWIWGY